MTASPLARTALGQLQRPRWPGQRQCPVCDHDLTNHDPIARRYCQATRAQALARKCICLHV
jgi:hypothetical protein